MLNVKTACQILKLQKGMSLVEIVLVIAAVGFLILLIANLPSSINLIGKAKNQSIAREIISKKIEDLRATQYANLANGESAILDNRIKLLPGGSGTVLIEDCDSSLCSLGEDSKQVTVKIIWKSGGKEQTASVKTLISEGGLK